MTRRVVLLSSALLVSGGCYFDFSATDAAVSRRDDADMLTIDSAPRPDGRPDALWADAWVPYEPDYTSLDDTGLYQGDLADGILNPELIEFEPVYKLWTDGALKTRYVLLPPNAQINSDDMDHWRFPPGTKFFKHFAYELGGEETIVETRLIERTGPGLADFYMVAFAWNEDQTEAVPVPDGVENAMSTDHDIPSTTDCRTCHNGERNQVMGFQAVQQSHGIQRQSCNHNQGGLCPTLSTLAARENALAQPLFTNVPSREYPVPGTGMAQQAVGYLHANCGHCHAPPTPITVNGCYTATQFHARVYTQDAIDYENTPSIGVTQTAVYQTGVEQALVSWVDESDGNFGPCGTAPTGCNPYQTRIVPGNAAASALYYRMAVRDDPANPPLDDDQQMPFLGTEFVHSEGVQLIEDWICSLDQAVCDSL